MVEARGLEAEITSEPATSRESISAEKDGISLGPPANKSDGPWRYPGAIRDDWASGLRALLVLLALLLVGQSSLLTASRTFTV
jgi:hypothetical protein